MIVRPARTSFVLAFSPKKAVRPRFLRGGLHPTEAKVLMQNDPQFAGAFSRDTDTVYVNDLAHNNATDAVNTVGHETQHYLDNQQNPNAERTEQYKDNRENYADIMGDATADYLGFNFAQNGSSLAGGNNHSLGSNADEAMRNLGLVTGNNTTYGAERSEALDDRYLNPEERKLAEQLAKDSGGRFTTQEMLDALRHARPSESTDYPQGMNENVLDTALATDETLKYLDGSEGRLIVTQDENGDARYIVQDMSNIPLNEDAKEYIKQQDLGYSFIEQVERTESLPVFRDMLTGKPLDESGRYMMGYDVDGNVYNVPHYSCATADCLSQKLNIDWNSPEGQAYQNALSAKALDDVSTMATGALLFTPPGALATGLGYLSLGASVGSGYLQDDLLKTTVSETSSLLYETALKEKLGKTLGGRINTGLSLIGLHDGIGSFVSDVSKLVTETPSGSSDSSKSNDVSKRESGE